MRDAAQAQKLVVFVAAGQSNMEGVSDRDNATDTDYSGIYQYPSAGGFIGTQAITTDVTPLRHNDPALRDGGTGNTGTTSWLSPAEYAAREMIEGGYCDKVLIIPGARGSTPLVSTTTPTWNPGVSGDLADQMIAQANAAIAAIASYPDFAGHSVEVVLGWVQGEKDGDNAETLANYRTQHDALIGRFRSEITGATNAKLVIGSMLPNYWMTSGGNYSANYEAINHAHVLQSLSLADAYYWLGADAPIASPNGKHYAPLATIRAQGRRIVYPLTQANTDLPTVTSTGTVGTTTGQAFSLPLTSDQPFATFHIVGGVDAASFEISDPFLDPVLRWVGDGTGPASDGVYVVDIEARNGAHVAGPTKTIAATASTPVAPTQVTYTAASVGAPVAGDSGTGSNLIEFDGVHFEIGLGVLLISCALKNIVGVTVGGNAATLVKRSQTISSAGDVDYTTIWQIRITTAGNLNVVITGSGSSTKLAMSAGTLIGADTTNVPSGANVAIKGAGSVANPATTTSPLTVPANGFGLAIARANSAITWNNGTPIDSILNADGTAQHSTAGFAATTTPSFNCAGFSGQAICAAAWGLAA